MLSWHIVTAETYYNADKSLLSDEKLYFLSDSGEIYRGGKKFDKAVEMLVGPDYAYPATPARGRIYIHPTTLEGKVYDGQAWTTVIKPVKDTISAEDTNPVNSKAVIAYVAQEIGKLGSSSELVKSVTYDKAGIKLTVGMADGTSSEVVLENVGVSLDYNKQTGALDLKDVNGAVLGSTVNLDLERFVSDASYDNLTHTITLTFNDAQKPLEIPVGDLVDTYTGKGGKGVSLTLVGNEFTAEAIVSATEGNMLELTESGLYVAATDLSSYMKLIVGATDGDIMTTNASGQAVDSGKKIGGSTFAAEGNASLLATEAAVQSAITSAISALSTTLTEKIDAKMAKVASATEHNVPTFDASGSVKDSGKKIGGATFAQTTDENTLATEKGAEAAIKAAVDTKVDKTAIATTLTSGSTDEQVASAKIVHDSLCWKTTL